MAAQTLSLHVQFSAPGFPGESEKFKRESDASLSHAHYFSCDMLYASYVHTHMWKGRAEGLARMARQLEQVHHLSSVMDSEQVANNIYMEHLKSVCIYIFD